MPQDHVPQAYQIEWGPFWFGHIPHAQLILRGYFTIAELEALMREIPPIIGMLKREKAAYFLAALPPAGRSLHVLRKREHRSSDGRCLALCGRGPAGKGWGPETELTPVLEPLAEKKPRRVCRRCLARWQHEHQHEESLVLEELRKEGAM